MPDDKHFYILGFNDGVKHIITQIREAVNRTKEKHPHFSRKLSEFADALEAHAIQDRTS